MAAIVIEFAVDDAYHREFHREWIAALGAGWRASRRLMLGFATAAVGLACSGWALNEARLTMLAAFALVVAGLIFAALARRRRVWMRCVRALPWFGQTLRLEVRDGDLVQVKNFAGDPRYQRTGSIVMTPNGYLVKYRGLGEAMGPEVSATEASVYIPHRAITPAMSRSAFLKSLSAVCGQGQDE